MTDPVIRRHTDYLRRQGRRERTLVDRRGLLLRLSDHLGAPLLTATPEQLDGWAQHLTVSLSSQQTYVCHVRAFYTWCVDVGLLDVSPAKDLPVPRLPKRLPRPIPEVDLKIVLRCAPEPERTWLLLSSYAGLRAGEISRIRREDISVDDGTTFLHVDGKGGKPRVVPLAKPVAAALTAHAIRQGIVFRSPSGAPWRSSHISTRITRLFQSIGMAYNLHSGRHRYGTVLYSLSQDMREVQQLMGHESLSTTALYVQNRSSKARRNVERLGRGLAA